MNLTDEHIAVCHANVTLYNKGLQIDYISIRFAVISFLRTKVWFILSFSCLPTSLPNQTPACKLMNSSVYFYRQSIFCLHLVVWRILEQIRYMKKILHWKSLILWFPASDNRKYAKNDDLLNYQRGSKDLVPCCKTD